ncbi:conserved hypothetical protein [Culex quinquefasciatus]|uniref:Pep3/Vps18 beta-propeller domain-containing protein n=1 Tax=Culex quinquefasciatus TaxID=7176 RepID=B0X8A2_CULQU|nr:conserved hypothetical protein [Culex quinquefasciatus]|eukprot:XP_001865874.1 conserved hypothetical protein [Culex quinquefasciatus]
MASMFDQYSSALVRETSTAPEPPSQPQSSGYVTVRTKKEIPIFAKQKMNLNLPTGILHLSVQNDWVIILMTNLTIFRLNIKQPDRFTEVPIDKYVGGLKPTGLFLDPLGAHVMVTFVPKSPGFTPEVLYLPRTSFKPKFVAKLKDQEITAVGFNYSNNSESSTGPILLGTSKGTIWEADIGVDGGDKLIQQNLRQQKLILVAIFSSVHPIVDFFPLLLLLLRIVAYDVVGSNDDDGMKIVGKNAAFTTPRQNKTGNQRAERFFAWVKARACLFKANCDRLTLASENCQYSKSPSFQFCGVPSTALCGHGATQKELHTVAETLSPGKEPFPDLDKNLTRMPGQYGIEDGDGGGGSPAEREALRVRGPISWSARTSRELLKLRAGSFCALMVHDLERARLVLSTGLGRFTADNRDGPSREKA